MKRCKQAFTLIELLVVICIIAILAAMLLPALQSARESASVATCVSNLGQMSKAFQMYATNYSDFMPALTDPLDGGSSCGWENALVVALGQSTSDSSFSKSFYCEGDSNDNNVKVPDGYSFSGCKKSYSLNNLKDAIHPRLNKTLSSNGTEGSGSEGYISGNRITSVYTASDLIVIGENASNNNKIGSASQGTDAVHRPGTASAIQQEVAFNCDDKPTSHSTAGNLFLDGHVKHFKPLRTLPSTSSFKITGKTSINGVSKNMDTQAWGSWSDCPKRKVGTACTATDSTQCRKTTN